MAHVVKFGKKRFMCKIKRGRVSCHRLGRKSRKSAKRGSRSHTRSSPRARRAGRVSPMNPWRYGPWASSSGATVNPPTASAASSGWTAGPMQAIRARLAARRAASNYGTGIPNAGLLGW